MGTTQPYHWCWRSVVSALIVVACEHCYGADWAIVVAKQEGQLSSCPRASRTGRSCGEYRRGHVYLGKEKSGWVHLMQRGKLMGYGPKEHFVFHKPGAEGTPPDPGATCTIRAPFAAASDRPLADACSPGNILRYLPQGVEAHFLSEVRLGPLAGVPATKGYFRLPSKSGQDRAFVWIPLSALKAPATGPAWREEMSRAYRYMVSTHPPPPAILKRAREAHDKGEFEHALEIVYSHHGIQLPRRLLAKVAGRLGKLDEERRLGHIPTQWKRSDDVERIACASRARKVTQADVDVLDKALGELDKLVSDGKQSEQRWANFTSYWKQLDQRTPKQVELHKKACECWQRYKHEADVDAAEKAIEFAKEITETAPTQLSLRPLVVRQSVHQRVVALQYELFADQSVRLCAFSNGHKFGEMFVCVVDELLWPQEKLQFIDSGTCPMKDGRALMRKGIQVERLADPSGSSKGFMKALCQVGVHGLRLGRNVIEVKAYRNDRLAAAATTTVYRRPYRSCHVVAVGCGAFQDASLSPLGYAARDAIDFSILALQAWGLPDSRVALLLDPTAIDDEQLRRLVAESCAKHGWLAGQGENAITELSQRIGRIAKPATLEGVEAKLAELSQKDPPSRSAAQEDDAVIVYFSTHGVVHPETHKVYLALADTRPAGDSSGPPGCYLHELSLWAAKLNAKHVLLVLDACHSGQIVAAAAEAEQRSAIEASIVRRVHVALASCPSQKRSIEALGNGLFTHHLLRLLAPGPDSARLDRDSDGWVTSLDLANGLRAVSGLRTVVYGTYGRACLGGHVLLPVEPLERRLWP